jgi:hypothetical protein
LNSWAPLSSIAKKKECEDTVVGAATRAKMPKAINAPSVEKLVGGKKLGVLPRSVLFLLL